MLQEAAEHLKRFYPDWNEKNLIFSKWAKWEKDKGQSCVEKLENSNNEHLTGFFAENTAKRQSKEPPQGFYFLEGNDGEI